MDSSANINALYFMKNGGKKFEISFDTTPANPIFRMLPYTSSGFFEIGNPSNSGADYPFIIEPTYGNVLIGPGMGNGTGQVTGAVPSTHKVQISGSMYVYGSLSATGDVYAYYSSDERLKENVFTISGSLDILKQINGYTFDWVPMEGIHENKGHDVGVIAQEIEAVLPELVTTRNNGYKAVKYEKLVALLIETNKELLKRIEALEAKIK